MPCCLFSRRQRQWVRRWAKRQECTRGKFKEGAALPLSQMRRKALRGRNSRNWSEKLRAPGLTFFGPGVLVFGAENARRFRARNRAHSKQLVNEPAPRFQARYGAQFLAQNSNFRRLSRRSLAGGGRAFGLACVLLCAALTQEVQALLPQILVSNGRVLPHDAHTKVLSALAHSPSFCCLRRKSSFLLLEAEEYRRFCIVA